MQILLPWVTMSDKVHEQTRALGTITRLLRFICNFPKLSVSVLRVAGLEGWRLALQAWRMGALPEAAPLPLVLIRKVLLFGGRGQWGYGDGPVRGPVSFPGSTCRSSR